jgi:hypothetical protein
MLNNTETALNKFSKGVVKQARTRLTKGKKNVTNTLYNEIDYDLTVSPNSFSLKFYTGDYGAFQDEGVKGADPSLVKNGKQKAPDSQFSYKDKRPPIKPLKDWIKARGLKYRDKDGRFKKGGINTLAFLISRSIYAQGIKPSGFFTKAFESQFKNLPQEVIKRFALDMQDLLTFTKK